METSYPKKEPTAAIDPVADLLGGGRVVAYKTDLGLALGSATAGLWLSQMWFWANTAETERTNKKRWDGDWVCWSQDEITAQTALTRRESDTARRDLRAVGVLGEDKRGIPMKIWYRLDKAKLYQLLRAYCDKKAAPTNLGGIRQDEETDAPAPDDDVQNVQPILAENANLDAQNRQTVPTDAPTNLGGKRQTIYKDACVEEQSEDHTYQKEQHKNIAQAPAADVFINKCNEASELVSSVAALGIEETDAASIVHEALKTANGADKVRRNAVWFPTSRQARTARCKGSTFRQSVRADWAKADADEKFARRMDEEQAARAHNRPVSTIAPVALYDAKPDRDDDENQDDCGETDKKNVVRAAVADLAARLVVKAPTPPARRPAPTQAHTEKAQAVDVDAIYATLSGCAKERLHIEAVAKATEMVPCKAPDIAAVPVEVTTETKGAAARFVLASRSEILRERAQNPFVVNGKNFYDAADARAAQTDLDFN